MSAAAECVFLLQVTNRFHAMAIITRVATDSEVGLYPFADYDQSKITFEDIVAAYCDDTPLEYPPLKRTGFAEPESCRGGMYERSLRDPVSAHHYIRYNDNNGFLEFHDGCLFDQNAAFQHRALAYLNSLGSSLPAVVLGHFWLYADPETETPNAQFGRHEIRESDVRIYEEHIRKHRRRERIAKELIGSGRQG